LGKKKTPYYRVIGRPAYGRGHRLYGHGGGARKEEGGKSLKAPSAHCGTRLRSKTGNLSGGASSSNQEEKNRKGGRVNRFSSKIDRTGSEVGTMGRIQHVRHSKINLMVLIKKGGRKKRRGSKTLSGPGVH